VNAGPAGRPRSYVTSCLSRLPVTNSAQSLAGTCGLIPVAGRTTAASGAGVMRHHVFEEHYDRISVSRSSKQSTLTPVKFAASRPLVSV